MRSERSCLKKSVSILVIGLTLFLCLGMTIAASAAGIDSAVQYVDAHRDDILNDWLTLIKIPSPSKQEDKRAEWVKQRMIEIGLSDVKVDDFKNVIGYLPGEPGAPTVVLDAHTDTVFSMDTKIEPVIKDGKIWAPGAGDDTSSVIAMLYAAEALKECGVTPKVNIVFAAVVQEEIGLYGTRHFLDTNRDYPVDMFIAVDGSLGGITYGALGIRWTKVTFTTPGGHTLRSWGKPSAVKSLGNAIARIYSDIEVPETPKSVLNLGVVGGGTVPNAIAAEAWVTVDSRSLDGPILENMVEQVREISEDTAKETGAEVKFEVMTDIPGGQLPGAQDAKLTRAAVDVLTSLGITPSLSAEGSCDSNAAIARGISSISVGVTTSVNGHSIQEGADIEPIYDGIKQLLLLVDKLN